MQEYKVLKVGDLTPHPANPRRGDVGAISESIAENGFYGAVVVQASTGHVLAGNHRLQAAKAQGLAEIPAIMVEVDDTTARRILLADNRTNDLAEYDDQALVDLLSGFLAETEEEDALAGTGFELIDLDALLNEIEKSQASAGGPDLGGGKASGSAAAHLTWGRSRIPLSDDDVALLDRLLDEHVKATGSQFGFIHRLIEMTGV